MVDIFDLESFVSKLTNKSATVNAVNAELNPYKVRLENILCETDMKEQVQSHK